MQESATHISSKLPRTLHAFGTSILLIPLGVASSILIARSVGPGGKGAFDVIIATGSLLVMALGLSLPSGVTYVVARGGADIRLLAKGLTLITVIQAFVAAVALSSLYYSGRSTYFLPDKIGTWLLIGIPVYVFLEIVSNHWRAILVGKQEIAKVNNCELLGRSMQFLLLFAVAGLLFLSGDRISVAVLFILNLATSVFINFILLRSLAPFLGPNGNGHLIKEAAAFALPCYFGNLTQFLNYRLDVFIVSIIAGYASVGRYTLAVSLGQLIWLLSNAAASVLLPKIAASSGSLDTVAHTSRVTRLALSASLIGAFGLALVASQVVPLLYGEAFRSSVGALLCILPGIVAFSTVNVLAAYIAGIGKPRLNLFVACVALIVTVVLDLMLIPRFNIIGAALASTASYSISAVLTIGLFLRETGVSLRELLLPTSEDFRVTMALAQPILRRARQLGVG